jgi:hypothetical protein
MEIDFLIVKIFYQSIETDRQTDMVKLMLVSDQQKSPTNQAPNYSPARG